MNIENIEDIPTPFKQKAFWLIVEAMQSYHAHWMEKMLTVFYVLKETQGEVCVID